MKLFTVTYLHLTSVVVAEDRVTARDAFQNKHSSFVGDADRRLLRVAELPENVTWTGGMLPKAKVLKTAGA